MVSGSLFPPPEGYLKALLQRSSNKASFCEAENPINRQPVKDPAMWNLINTPETEIFGIAIALMLMLGLLELLSLLVGGFTDWLDNLLPDSLVEADLDGDLHAGIEGAGALVRFLDWLYVERVLLLVFLAMFRLVGYVLQSLCARLFEGYLNAWLAVAAALFLALPLVHFMTGGLYKIMPKDGTTAISQESLGQQHYVMAEPDPMAKVC